MLACLKIKTILTCLYDLCLAGPVVESILRQAAERPQPGPQRQDDVGLRDCLHGGLGALVSERAHPVGVGAREGVVVQVGGADGGGEGLREGGHGEDAVGAAHGHAAACIDIGRANFA